jgi:hypothetical protein
MLSKADKEKLLEVFNIIDPSPWTQESYKFFFDSYKALIASLEKPILDKINNSEFRKTIKVVRHPEGEPIKVKPGTKFLLSLTNSDELGVTGEDGEVKVFQIQAAKDVRLGQVTPENIEKMIEQVSSAITDFEARAVIMLKDLASTENVTLYIVKDFVPYEDPFIVKQQKIGFYGWSKLAVVSE